VRFNDLWVSVGAMEIISLRELPSSLSRDNLARNPDKYMDKFFMQEEAEHWVAKNYDNGTVARRSYGDLWPWS
jgi:hypothetical protein